MIKDEITLPLGFRFVSGHVVVEVQDGNMHCTGCYFFNGACSLPWYNIKCSSGLRLDGKDVRFVKVGEVKR